MNDPTISNAHRDRIEFLLAASAVGLVALIIILVFALVFFKITPDATEIGMVMAVVTPTVGLAIAVYGFFYGGSKGGQAKDNVIANQLPPPVVPPVAVITDPAKATTGEFGPFAPTK